MEPLSLLGSVVGILSVTAKLTTLCTDLIERGKRVPESVHSMVLELNGLRECLAQLRPFLHGTEQASITRSTMISVDQVITINTSCVLTLSDLERILDSYKLDGPLSRLDRLRWVKNESKFNRLLLRVRASRSSLNLILTILTCVSIEQARNAIGTLVPTVEDIRQSSKDVSRRLAVLETALASRTTRASSIVKINERMSSLRDSRILANGQSNLVSPSSDTDTLTIGACSRPEDESLPVKDDTKVADARNGILHLNTELELLLEESRPYSRLRPTQPKPLASSVSYFSGAVSHVSGLSLSDVSSLSVLSLPIFMHEIWNNHHYNPSPSVQRSSQVQEIQLDTADDRKERRPEIVKVVAERPLKNIEIPSASEEIGSLDDWSFPRRNVKILMLGASDSGKSTMLKQMRIALQNEFANPDGLEKREQTQVFGDVERYEWRQTLLLNLLTAFITTTEAIEEYEWQFQKAESLTFVATIKDAVESCMIINHVLFDRSLRSSLWVHCILAAIEGLWTDPIFQRMLKRGSEYVQYDNVDYFFEHRNRILSPSSQILEQDILHARLRSVGIGETLLETKGLIYHIFDVGGSRSDRKKWGHVFDTVHCLYFVASLAGYDACLVEDMTRNQMQESLFLFDSILSLGYFKESAIILFLSKMDIFKRKIKEHAIGKKWPDFEGPEGDYQSAVTYFTNKFRALQKPDDTREIHIYVIDTTDTIMMQGILQEIEENIILPGKWEESHKCEWMKDTVGVAL